MYLECLKSVFGKHKMYSKYTKCIHLLGLFVEYAFRRTLFFSKIRQASQISVISRNYRVAPKPSVLCALSIDTPFFPEFSVCQDQGEEQALDMKKEWAGSEHTV